MLARIFRFITRTFIVLVVIVATIILVRAFDSRAKPDLQAWHLEELENEFRANDRQGVESFPDYVAMEARLYEELDRKVLSKYANADVQFNRYVPESVFNAANDEQNWNRSFELKPAAPRGGVVVLHGLTDSPYSMRSIASLFFENGYYVVGIRLPGHGTTPGELSRAHWEDWAAAVKIAAQHVVDTVGDEVPFVMAGYSNGGLLSVNYVLDAIDEGIGPFPDRVYLVSPAIGITAFATFATWHKSLSFLPYFHKFKWESVLPEYDPYKYNSFPKQAGHETFELTGIVRKKLDRLGKSGLLKNFPATITFSSLVDSTVLTAATVNHFYTQLDGPQYELVLFDVNRKSDVQSLIKKENVKLLEAIEADDSRSYTLTLVTNQSSNTNAVVAVTSSREKGNTEHALELDWPFAVYSLSHVALPFSEDDPLYGARNAPGEARPSLGALSVRGERNVLGVSIANLMRLRYNPFFGYMQERISEDIASNQ